MAIHDYIVISVILAWLIAAVWYIMKQRKAGRRVSCGGGCADCAGCGLNEKGGKSCRVTEKCR